MTLRHITLACAAAAVMLPAHVFATGKLTFKEFDSIALAPAPVQHAAAATTATEYHEPLTGDFDWCYYWYDFSTGSLSDTWETSKYEYIAENPDGTFSIKNFMRETLNPNPSDNSFEVAEITAEYDMLADAYIIAGNQYLYTLDTGDTTVDIHLIGVRLNSAGKLQPDKDIDIVLTRDGMGYRLDTSKEAVAVLIGAYMPSGGYGGLGICQRCALYAWNGTMIYLVGTGDENESIPYTCNVWAELHGNNLYLANYADCGYTRGVDFSVDFAVAAMTANDASLQTLFDMNGDTTELYAADMLDNGDALTVDGHYRLTASYYISQGATMILQSGWGAYFMGEPVGIYTNTYTLLDFDITNPSAGITVPTVPCDGPEVYYNLQGIKVDRPAHGLYICRGRKVFIP